MEGTSKYYVVEKTGFGFVESPEGARRISRYFDTEEEAIEWRNRKCDPKDYNREDTFNIVEIRKTKPKVR